MHFRLEVKDVYKRNKRINFGRLSKREVQERFVMNIRFQEIVCISGIIIMKFVGKNKFTYKQLENLQRQVYKLNQRK